MKQTFSRLNKIASHLPFDPAYWLEKNRHQIEQGNRRIWEALSDEEFEAVHQLTKVEGEFDPDLGALTD